MLDFVNRVSPTALFECSRCGALVFDAQRIEGRMCQAHESDVRDLMEAAGAPRRALAG